MYVLHLGWSPSNTAPLTQSLAKGVMGGRSDSAQCQAGVTAHAGVKAGVSLPESSALGGRQDPLLCPQPQGQPQMLTGFGSQGNRVPFY